MDDNKHTIRLPNSLAEYLEELQDLLGMTKSDLLRFAILKFLAVDQLEDFADVSVAHDDSKRINLRLTPFLEQIISDQSKKTGQSVNSLVIFAAEQAYKYYSDMLEQQEKSR